MLVRLEEAVIFPEHWGKWHEEVTGGHDYHIPIYIYEFIFEVKLQNQERRAFMNNNGIFFKGAKIFFERKQNNKTQKKSLKRK